MLQFSSVQFTCSVVSNSLWPHESQHARPPCPSPTPGVYPNSCPSSWWCHPAISSSVVPFSSCPQSLPASESFPVSQLFAWGGQSTGVSALASFYQIGTPEFRARSLAPPPTPAKISQDSARSGFSCWASLAWFHHSLSQFWSSVPLSPSSPKERNKKKFLSN